MTDPKPTFLTDGAIRQRMRCKGNVASIIEDTFVTVEQLVEAVESDEPLTDYDGIGPKTAEKIEEWWENREEREKRAKETTVSRTSRRSATIKFHGSWAEAIGMEEDDD